MTTFLLKTEPGSYSYADLARDKSTSWTGVSNPAALAAIRTMRQGDEAFIYHTGDEKAIVGLAKVMSDPYEDPERPGSNDRGEPRFACVEIKAVRSVKASLPLSHVKADSRFKDFALVKQSRLSVMPVPAALDAVIRKLTGL